MSGLRARKKADTRQRLMSCAVALFLERGFDETTVEAIAEAADVSPRTFFRYFPTKVDVLFADVEERFALLAEALAQVGDEPLLPVVRRVATEFVGGFAADRELYLGRARLVFGDPRILPYALARVGRVEALVAEAAARQLGAGAGDVRPRLVGAAFAAAIRSTALTWLARDGEGDPARILEEALDVLEQGLASTMPS